MITKQVGRLKVVEGISRNTDVDSTNELNNSSAALNAFIYNARGLTATT